MILVTGASASGKSEFAEQLVLAQGECGRVYIATMRVWDDEGRETIARHRQMRSTKNFETIECGTDLAGVKPEAIAGKVVLLECMSNLTANELFEAGGTPAEIRARVLSGIRHLINHARELIVVTNEVFSDGGRYSEETRIWLELLGLLNQDLAAMSGRVAEVVYGIPVWVKDIR